jgi:hypothetical protein
MTFVTSLEAHLQMIKPSANIQLSRMLQNVQCSRLDNKHVTICSLYFYFLVSFQLLFQEKLIVKQLIVYVHL